MNNIIKYCRFLDNKLILIPTAQGLEYNKSKPLEVVSERGEKIPFVSGTETIGGQPFPCLEVTLPGNIIHMQQDISVVNNTSRTRVYAAQVSYYLNIPTAV